MFTKSSDKMTGIAESGSSGDSRDGNTRLIGQLLLRFVNAHLCEVSIRSKSECLLK
ncbi:hypothetical protein D3C76_1810900 [compost metagenome]